MSVRFDKITSVFEYTGREFRDPSIGLKLREFGVASHPKKGIFYDIRVPLRVLSFHNMHIFAVRVHGIGEEGAGEFKHSAV